MCCIVKPERQIRSLKLGFNLNAAILPFSGPGTGVLHVESDLHLQTEDVLILQGPLLVVRVREEMPMSPHVAS